MAVKPITYRPTTQVRRIIRQMKNLGLHGLTEAEVTGSTWYGWR